jgi:hypothetical protein
MSAKGVNFYEDTTLDYPEWLFSSKFSPSAKSLIVSMLHPDPSERISVGMAMNHQWLRHDTKSLLNTLSTINSDLTTTQDVSTGRSAAAPSTTAANTLTSLGNTDAMDTEVDVDMDGTEVDMECDDASNGNDDDEDSIFKMDDDATSSSGGTAMSRPPLKPPSPMLAEKGRVGGSGATVSTSSSEYGFPRRSTPISSPIVINLGAMPIPIPQSPGVSQAQSMVSGSWSAVQLPSQSNEFISRSMPNTWVSMPPTLPHLSLEQIMKSGTAPPDLFTGVVEEDALSPSAASRSDGSQAFAFSRISNTTKPPSFHDNVKRSTRFITAVAAAEVFQKLECVLIECKGGRLTSPVGVISRIELSYEHYTLEIWGADPSGPPICTIRIFRMPSEGSGASVPSNVFGMSPGGAFPSGASTPSMYLVEFVRGQIEIFAFKRFYDWVRQQVGELVKRDYGTSSLDQFGSPM